MSRHINSDWENASLVIKHRIWEDMAYGWYQASKDIGKLGTPGVVEDSCSYCLKFKKLGTPAESCNYCPIFRPVRKGSKLYLCGDIADYDLVDTLVSKYFSGLNEKSQAALAARIFKIIIKRKEEDFPELCEQDIIGRHNLIGKIAAL